MNKINQYNNINSVSSYLIETRISDKNKCFKLLIRYFVEQFILSLTINKKVEYNSNFKFI